MRENLVASLAEVKVTRLRNLALMSNALKLASSDENELTKQSHVRQHIIFHF